MTEEKIITKKKKGSVHYKKDKTKNPELTVCDGCEGCNKICRFKGKIVHPKESFSEIFLCNSTRKEK